MEAEIIELRANNAFLKLKVERLQEEAAKYKHEWQLLRKWKHKMHDKEQDWRDERRAMQLDIQAGEEARKFKESYKTVIMHTAVSSFVHRCQHKKALFDCFETIILLLYRFVRERESDPSDVKSSQLRNQHEAQSWVTEARQLFQDSGKPIIQLATHVKHGLAVIECLLKEMTDRENHLRTTSRGFVERNGELAYEALRAKRKDRTTVSTQVKLKQKLKEMDKQLEEAKAKNKKLQQYADDWDKTLNCEMYQTIANYSARDQGTVAAFNGDGVGDGDGDEPGEKAISGANVRETGKLLRDLLMVDENEGIEDLDDRVEEEQRGAGGSSAHERRMKKGLTSESAHAGSEESNEDSGEDVDGAKTLKRTRRRVNSHLAKLYNDAEHIKAEKAEKNKKERKTENETETDEQGSANNESKGIGKAQRENEKAGNKEEEEGEEEEEEEKEEEKEEEEEQEDFQDYKIEFMYLSNLYNALDEGEEEEKKREEEEEASANDASSGANKNRHHYSTRKFRRNKAIMKYVRLMESMHGHKKQGLKDRSVTSASPLSSSSAPVITSAVPSKVLFAARVKMKALVDKLKRTQASLWKAYDDVDRSKHSVSLAEHAIHHLKQQLLSHDILPAPPPALPTPPSFASTHSASSSSPAPSSPKPGPALLPASSPSQRRGRRGGLRGGALVSSSLPDSARDAERGGKRGGGDGGIRAQLPSAPASKGRKIKPEKAHSEPLVHLHPSSLWARRQAIALHRLKTLTDATEVSALAALKSQHAKKTEEEESSKKSKITLALSARYKGLLQKFSSPSPERPSDQLQHAQLSSLALHAGHRPASSSSSSSSSPSQSLSARRSHARPRTSEGGTAGFLHVGLSNGSSSARDERPKRRSFNNAANLADKFSQSSQVGKSLNPKMDRYFNVDNRHIGRRSAPLAMTRSKSKKYTEGVIARRENRQSMLRRNTLKHASPAMTDLNSTLQHEHRHRARQRRLGREVQDRLEEPGGQISQRSSLRDNEFAMADYNRNMNKNASDKSKADAKSIGEGGGEGGGKGGKRKAKAFSFSVNLQTERMKRMSDSHLHSFPHSRRKSKQGQGQGPGPGPGPGPGQLLDRKKEKGGRFSKNAAMKHGGKNPYLNDKVLNDDYQNYMDKNNNSTRNENNHNLYADQSGKLRAKRTRRRKSMNEKGGQRRRQQGTRNQYHHNSRHYPQQQRPVTVSSGMDRGGAGRGRVDTLPTNSGFRFSGQHHTQAQRLGSSTLAMDGTYLPFSPATLDEMDEGSDSEYCTASSSDDDGY